MVVSRGEARMITKTTPTQFLLLCVHKFFLYNNDKVHCYRAVCLPLNVNDY